MTRVLSTIGLCCILFHTTSAQSPLDLVFAQAISDTVYPGTIKALTDGSLVAQFEFNSTVDIDPGVGAVLIDAPSQLFPAARCFARYSTTGQYLSHVRLPKTSVRDWEMNTAGELTVLAEMVANDSADIDPGPASAWITAQSLFICRFAATGALLWYTELSGAAQANNYIKPTTFVVDAGGSIILVGAFKGTVDVDPGPLTTPLTSATDQAFLWSLSSGGAYQWVQPIDYGTQSPWNPFRDLTMDGAGNYIITGGFAGIIDLDPGPAIQPVTAQGIRDAFIVKYDPAFALLWGFRVGGGCIDGFGESLVDGAGDIYVKGSLSPMSCDNMADVDPGAGTVFVTYGGGEAGGSYIVKYSSAGEYLFSIDHHGNGFWGFDVKEPRVLVTGRIFYDPSNPPNHPWATQFDFDVNGPGVADLGLAVGLGEFFVASYSTATGAFEWVEGGGQFLPNVAGDQVSFYSVAALGTTTVCLAGAFGDLGPVACNVDMDFGTDVSLISSQANEKAFAIARYEVCVPADSVTAEAQPPTVLQGVPATLSVLPPSALNSADDWYWYEGACGGTLVGVGSSVQVTPTQSTAYYVRGEGSCAVGACAQVEVTVSGTGLPPLPNGNNTLLFHPNPTPGPLRITGSAGVRGIRVSDVLGRNLQEYAVVPSDGLDLSRYPSGVYTVSFHVDGRTHQQRIVKH